MGSIYFPSSKLVVCNGDLLVLYMIIRVFMFYIKRYFYSCYCNMISNIFMLLFM